MSKIDQIFLNFFFIKTYIKKKNNFCYCHILITLIFNVVVFLKESPIFNLQFWNDRKAKNIFMDVFVVLWPYLFTTKLSCLKKNNFGHTKVCNWKKVRHAHCCLKIKIGVFFSYRYSCNDIIDNKIHWYSIRIQKQFLLKRSRQV